MTKQPPHDDTQLLLQLQFRMRSNEWRMRGSLAIVLICATAAVVDMFWHPTADGLASMLSLLGLCLIVSVALWFNVKLARENSELQKQIEELAKKLRML